MFISDENTTKLDLKYLGHMHNLNDILLYLYFNDKTENVLDANYDNSKILINYIQNNKLKFSKSIERVLNLIRGSALNIELCNRLIFEKSYKAALPEYETQKLFVYLTELCKYYDFDMGTDLLSEEEITFKNILALLDTNGISIAPNRMICL